MSNKIVATDISDEEVQTAVFFERADQFIKQANDFCRPQTAHQGLNPPPVDFNPAQLRGQVSASMLFATARFNTWVASNNFANAEEMQNAKPEVMAYLVQQFQMMLEDNYDEYCEQFENYLRFRHNEEFHTHKHEHRH